jgi:XTP/dITP diphosphohydrolase
LGSRHVGWKAAMLNRGAFDKNMPRKTETGFRGILNDQTCGCSLAFAAFAFCQCSLAYPFSRPGMRQKAYLPHSHIWLVFVNLASFKMKLMKLVFATNNQHKLKELQQILGDEFQLLSLKDIGCDEEIPENQETLEGNASEKSFFIYNKYGHNCFADDTGLEIEALDGEPGVYSARYAGEEKSADANMEKVLKKMKEIKNRNARFRSVISLVIDGNERQFEGVVDGKILHEKRGDEGFGYDPVFQPDGYVETFAEMGSGQKNQISHRGRAVQKLVNYLKHRT